MFPCCHYYFRLPSSRISSHTTCISLSLRRTSAPIHLISVLGVLGTQETSCFLIAGLLERDILDLYLPEFDKPWVIHLRETCCCPTNLCTWRPNTVYKNRSVRRNQGQIAFFASYVVSGISLSFGNFGFIIFSNFSNPKPVSAFHFNSSSVVPSFV